MNAKEGRDAKDMECTEMTQHASGAPGSRNAYKQEHFVSDPSPPWYPPYRPAASKIRTRQQEAFSETRGAGLSRNRRSVRGQEDEKWADGDHHCVSEMLDEARHDLG